MSFIRYKIGQNEQYIQFNNKYEKIETILNFLTDNFNLKLEEGEVDNPTIQFLSIPKGIQTWEKNIFPCYDHVLFYIKQMEKLQIIITSKFGQPEEVANILFKCMISSLILRKDILLLHSILLSNGDIIFGQPYSGKSTLANRIFNVTKDIKCLSDDIVLIDLKNNQAYPVPYFWKTDSVFIQTKVNFKPIKINRILFLKQSDKQVQDQIIEMQKDEFFKHLMICSTIYLYFPFANREKWTFSDTNYYWSSFKEGFRERMCRRINEIIKKYEERFLPLQFITSNDIKNKNLIFNQNILINTKN